MRVEAVSTVTVAPGAETQVVGDRVARTDPLADVMTAEMARRADDVMTAVPVDRAVRTAETPDVLLVVAPSVTGSSAEAPVWRRSPRVVRSRASLMVSLARNSTGPCTTSCAP